MNRASPEFLVLVALASACAVDAPAVEMEEQATFAGRAADEQTFVAVVRNGTSILVYGCDDARGAWFRADALVSPMELANDAGDSLFLALGEDDVAVGELRFADAAEPVAFAVPRTDEEVLFRADGAVSGDALVGGWIRLPDGEQRGVVSRAGERTTSRVAVTDGSLRVDGTFAERLAPAAFTPARLAAPTPARAARFDLYAMGDSYGAGEAAPERPGDYRDDGTLEDGGRREEWDTSLTTDAARREARACHRSGISGVERAADILRARYGGALDLRLTSFACSGSQTEHLTECPYRGAIGDDFDRSSELLAPQVGRVRAASRAEGVDAVYLSIGGNDLQFGRILGKCLREGILGEGIAGDICGAGTEIDRLSLSIARGTGGQRGMSARYAAIAAELGTLLPRRSQHVYISQYPNPLVAPDGNPCEEVDILESAGFGTIGGDEIVWLADTVATRLNTAVQNAADSHGWSLISGHLPAFRQHGYCSDDPWFADNGESLRAQGRGMTDALNARSFPVDACMSPPETRDDPGPIDPAVIGGGIVHPDRDGYALGYGPAIAESIDAQLEDHVRPLPVSGLRIQAQVRNGGITLAWDDRASTETEYRVALRYEEGVALPAEETVVLPADSRSFDVPLSVRARGTASITPCLVGPRPMRRAVCGEARTLRWSNFAPVRALMDVRVDTTERAPIDVRDPATPQRRVRVVWTASSEHGVVYYDLELRHVDGTTRRIATTDSAFVATAQLAGVRVRACGFVGCTEPSREAIGPACAVGQVVGLDGACVVGSSSGSLDTRELACLEVSRDPGGVCTGR